MPVTVRLKIANAKARIAYRKPIIEAATREGRVFQLSHPFKTIAEARAVAEKVRAKSTIDIQYWQEMPPIPGSIADMAQAA